MMKPILLPALTAVLMASAYASPKLEISPAVLNADLPSASGLSARGRSLFAVGDDSPWLFELNRQFQITGKQLIKDYPVEANGRIPKKIKPDYEAMTQVRIGKQYWRIVLGSGSKADVREWGYMLSADQQTKLERNLKPLYAQLYAASGFSGEETLNIEGLATAGGHAYVFNRGNSGSNLIFRLDQAEFIAYMQGKLEQVSKLDVFKVSLPRISNFEAGLSGGDFWPQANSLVYTASVEATGDAYNDGAILGSFVGLIPLDSFVPGQTIDLAPSSVLLTRKGQAVITKLESIAITEADTDEIEGVLVSDNDNGTSEFFRFELELND
ncbi:DUF6929 family protein [Chitinilyticum litopenaei]|uniref:DUF6929 family protein n=1 Tax=Chitinilyticum litopenaei TaxID=1121276 RepID=UPI00040A18B1|nr:hypothetical protein [Chitinilyticum litopenaei]